MAFMQCGNVTVIVLDSRFIGPGVDSRPFHFYVMMLAKLFTYIYTSVTQQHNSVLA